MYRCRYDPIHGAIASYCKLCELATECSYDVHARDEAKDICVKSHTIHSFMVSNNSAHGYGGPGVYDRLSFACTCSLYSYPLTFESVHDGPSFQPPCYVLYTIAQHIGAEQSSSMHARIVPHCMFSIQTDTIIGIILWLAM